MMLGGFTYDHFVKKCHYCPNIKLGISAVQWVLYFTSVLHSFDFDYVRHSLQ